jgi:thioredoxin 1
MIPNISSDTFSEFIQSSELPIVVDFWAEWCGPCKRIGPVLDEIQKHFPDQILIGKVNIDQSPEIAKKYNVMSIPMLLIFKGGVLQSGVLGAKSYASYLKDFELG